MKHNTSHFCRIHLGDLHQMPRNSLSLAVIIGCEPDGVRFSRLFSDVIDDGFLVVQNLILGFEIVGDIDTHALGGKIAHVPLARDHGVILSDELLDGFCLRR